MARKKSGIKKIDIQPDTKYGHAVLAKFINCLMCCGKKSKAETIVYGALNSFVEKVGNVGHIEGFEKIILNVRPTVELRSRRVGGATYQIPMEITPKRGINRALRWLIGAAVNSKAGKSMSEKLAIEFVDAYNNRGNAIKKRDDTHKMAAANKAFVHYKWGS